MRGFRNPLQRAQVCTIVAGWVRPTVGFEPFDGSPTGSVLTAVDTGQRPDGGKLSPGQVAILKLVADVWSAGAGGLTVPELDDVRDDKRALIGELLTALSKSPDHVDKWIDKATSTQTAAQRGR